MKINLNINDYCIDKVKDIILKNYVDEDADKIGIEDTIKKEILQLPEMLKNEMKPYVIYKMNSGATGDKNADSSTCSIAVLSMGEAYEKIYAKVLEYGSGGELVILEEIYCLLIDEMIKEFKKLYYKLHRRYIKNIIMVDCKNPENKEIMLKLIKQFDVYKMRCTKEDNSKEKSKKNYNDIYKLLISSQMVVFYAFFTENPDDFSLLI